MNRIVQTCIVLCAFVLTTSVSAEEENGQHSGAYPPVPLATILEAVSKKTGRVFLTSSDAQREVVVGQVKAKDMTYSSLLIVLFNNGLAAVTAGDVTNIVQATRVRQFALPIISQDDDTIDDYEWVTRVVEVKNMHAPQMVPILRPLVPQMGHMVAHADSNSVIIGARYGNAKRLADLIVWMDARSTPTPQP